MSAAHPSHPLQSACDKRRTGCLPLSEIIRSRRFSWFGHIARASPELDHRRALYAAVHGEPRDWKRRRGRQTHTWTRTVEAYLKPANIDLFSAWRRAKDWSHSDRQAPESGSLMMMMMVVLA